MRSKNKSGKRKRRSSWYVIWGLIFIILIASVISVIITLPVFKISGVVVEGTRLLSPDTIEHAAAIPVGDNLFLTNFGPAKKRVLAINAVKDVRITRRLPDTVLISVTERKEAAVTVISAQSFLLDDEGVFINPASGEAVTINFPDITNLPVVVGISEDQIDRGGRLKGAAGDSASKLLTEFKHYIAPFRLKIDLTDSGNIGLLLDDTLRVKFGSHNEIDRKIKTFETIYDKLKDRKDTIEYIDVRFPDFPAVRYK